jgi:hypothetical protein
VALALGEAEIHLSYGVSMDVPDPWEVRKDIVHAVRCPD